MPREETVPHTVPCYVCGENVILPEGDDPNVIPHHPPEGDLCGGSGMLRMDILPEVSPEILFEEVKRRQAREDEWGERRKKGEVKPFEDLRSPEKSAADKK